MKIDLRRTKDAVSVRRIRLAGWAVLCWAMLSPANAQLHHPDPGFVYDDSSLPRIDISMAQADLDAMYADPWSDIMYQAAFSFTREGLKEDVAGVGIRIRGNTSRGKNKKSFRISFNSFEGPGRFHDIQEMNLNAETNDPSLMRSKLSWHIFRHLGVPAARINHVLLYLNGDYYGVYNNTEHIDENFMKARFDNNDGNLYKCLWPADLAYLGSDPSDYIIEKDDGSRVYDLRTNEDWDDYADLSDFVTTLHQRSGAALREELEGLMNVQQYLKVMAGDVISANWDGYIGNKNNYYLYRDQASGRIQYIPYDLDNTWGLDWLGVDWAHHSIYQWAREERPLYDKLMSQQVYKEQYTTYVRELCAYITSDELVQEVLRWRSQISSWVRDDPFYPQDFEYGYTDFLNALSHGDPDRWWLTYGVLEYAGLRAASALEQSIQADADPLFSHVRVMPGQEGIRADWSVEDDGVEWSTTLHYRIKGGEWISLVQEDAYSVDAVSGVHSYREMLPWTGEHDVFEVYFTARDQGGQESRYPAQALELNFPPVNGPLFINEFMASNASGHADEFGEYDDWVELYNGGSAPLWLGALFLSDRKGDPGKFKLPNYYLPPGGFVLLWLDGQAEQGDHHAPFRISSEGEHLRLSGRPAEGYPILDSISFGPQESDVSTGRSTDGAGEWLRLARGTPGLSNNTVQVEESLALMEELIIYPNPATAGQIRFNRPVSAWICSLDGRLIQRVNRAESADISQLTPGVYLLRTDPGEALCFVVGP